MPTSYTCLYYHIGFSTKERHPWLTPDIRQLVYDYMGGISRPAGSTSPYGHVQGGID
ncbi:MAG TPA: hypothetical protein VGM23_08865 [Armatimonadota bacterium]